MEFLSSLRGLHISPLDPQGRQFFPVTSEQYELLSKLLVYRLITPIILPYTIPFKELRL